MKSNRTVFAPRCVSVLVFSVILLLSVNAAAQEPGIGGTWTISFAGGGNPDATQDSRAPAGPPPLKPEYAAIWEARQTAAREATARGEPLATAATFCLPQGMPAMMGGGGPFPMEILPSLGQVTIIQEAYTQVRRIYLDTPQVTLDDIEPGFYGRSVGNWEGDTLVVDTIGVKESVEYRDVPHTLDMRITERLHLVEPDVLWDEVTIEDPEVLEEPWRITFVFNRLPGYEIMEYVCENNREYADETGATRLRTGRQ
jgi:hypothetical protein